MAGRLGVATLIWASAHSASASPFMPQPVGARAVGRAGAVVASGHGVDALASNPAGLVGAPGARAPGLELSGALGLGAIRLKLLRQGIDRGVEYPLVESRAGSFTMPSFGVRVTLLGGRLALGALRYDAAHEQLHYPVSTATNPTAKMDPQRYLAGSFEARRQSYGFGAALRSALGISLGVGVTLNQLTLGLDRHGWIGLGGSRARSEDPAFDLPASVRLAADLVPAVIGGVTVRPAGSPLTLALSLEVPAQADLTGTLRITSPKLPAGYPLSVRAEGASTLTMPLELPLVARAGVRLAGRRAELELDAELAYLDGDDGWSATVDDARLVVTGVSSGAVSSTPIETMPLALTARTRYTLAAATELAVVPDFFMLRAGYSFASASAPEALWTAASPQGQAHGLGIGLAVESSGLRLEVGWLHTITTQQRVEASAWRHWNLLEPANSEDVGSGRYSSSSDTVSLGLSIDLGAARRAFAPPPLPPEPLE